MSIELDQHGIALLDPGDIDNGASDDCGVVAISSGQTEFGCSDVGESITDYYTLVDHNGNIGSCDTNITVRDSVVSMIFTECLLLEIRRISVYSERSFS